jgi:5-methylcytosine-specific restriction endonuclease McrA
MALTHQSAWWKRVSIAHLRLHPLCLCCKTIGRVIAAALTDHVIPVSQGGKWNGPVQSTCHRCHSTVKRTLEALYAKGKATAADLKLDSPMAQRLARQEYRRIDPETGWPTLDLLP